ncbi:hypothetical protein GCM10010982_31170 [Bowmanella pacifica]|uniref:Uncharacterized protein n=1 Tax=Bowmanella pacifica TaxID=502051 RepID=A0A917Z1Z6_9ALTE|nr:hypothetical protein GCM10010982_31170 [Bowmanella pacifica]
MLASRALRINRLGSANGIRYFVIRVKKNASNEAFNDLKLVYPGSPQVILVRMFNLYPDQIAGLELGIPV